MRWTLSITAVSAMTLAASLFAADPVVISMDTQAKGHAVPKTLYGIFFEDINFSADGGVYPELIANRGFDWPVGGWRSSNPRDQRAWTEDFRGGAMARITLQHGKPVHEATSGHVRIETFGPGAGCGIRNDGFNGIAVKKGAKYDLTFYARALDGYKGGIRVLLETADGRTLCRYDVPNEAMSISPVSKTANEFILPDWKRYETVFTAPETVSNAHLSILTDAPGVVELEQVSLFPQDTFKGRKNGLRKDLVQLIKDLKPGIMRFPGGCITEGHDFANWYDWKRSVGDGSLESRPVNWNLWGYWQTHGLGYFEFFQLCEDIGAEPLPVVASGLTCQVRGAKLAPLDSMPYFVQNVLDLIEFANGPVDSKWGALRAKMGHPEPFNMKYVGIGNENWNREYFDRYFRIQKIVKEKHPEIKVISSSGVAAGGREFDYAWSVLNPSNADLVDEHYYVTADWLLKNTRRYDSYDRKGCKVFPGEYACNQGPDNGNILYAALCEAAMMTGFERNSDIVEMTAYAPLFAKVGNTQWAVDMIHFDNTRVFGTPNYYVQKLFSTNLPTRFVPSTQSTVSTSKQKKAGGAIILRTWNTAAEFRNITVTQRGRKERIDLNSPAAWQGGRRGEWTIENGVVRQSSLQGDHEMRSSAEFPYSEYALSFEARKIRGEEGFIVGLRDASDSKIYVNFGGWGNSKHAIQAGTTGEILRQSRGAIRDGEWRQVRIVLNKDFITVQLDGKTVFSRVRSPEPDNPTFFSVCGYDQKTKEYIVKCVNVADSERKLEIDFGGISIPMQRAKRATLSGDKYARNDLDNPERCAPVYDRVNASGKTFRTTLKPYSLTVFRFKRSDSGAKQ